MSDSPMASITIVNAPRDAQALANVPGVRFTLARLANDLNMFGGDDQKKQAFRSLTIPQQAEGVSAALMAYDAAQKQEAAPPKREPRTRGQQVAPAASPPISAEVVVQEMVPAAIDSIPKILAAFDELKKTVQAQDVAGLREVVNMQSSVIGFLLSTTLTIAEQVTGIDKKSLVPDLLSEVGAIMDMVAKAAKNRPT